MDNPTTLLVAIMFVTIVVTGLVTVLMSLSGWVTGQQKYAPLHGAWLLFLLITYQLFVRYTPIGTMLNGRRTRPPGSRPPLDRSRKRSPPAVYSGSRRR